MIEVEFKDVAELALKWGARPGTIRVWRVRGTIPVRFQLRLLQHFGQSVKIVDWLPDAVATIDRSKLAERAKQYIFPGPTS